MFAIDECFERMDDWTAWAEKNPAVFDSRAADDLARRILKRSFREPLTGRRPWRRHIGGEPGGWRDSLFAYGVNSRQRAVLHLIETTLEGQDRERVTLFATEALTPLAKVLGGHFPRFVGSEYAETEDDRRALLPILHQDLMALALPSDAFDLVTTNDVLEHVPDLDRGLGEIARVLKPGGWHVGTHPFRFMDQDGDVRAVLRDGAVAHLKEPEHHVNPTAPDRGSLVFETPGWDILERCRAQGFSRAHMRFVASERHGYLSENLGIFVLCAQK
jgi:SAM-dependent methyltransferase